MKIILEKKSKPHATKKTCIWVSAAISRYLPFQNSSILQQSWPNKIPSSCEFKCSELILPYLLLHLRSGSILKAYCMKMSSLVHPTTQRKSVWYSVSSFHFKKLLLIKRPLDVSLKLPQYNIDQKQNCSCSATTMRIKACLSSKLQYKHRTSRGQFFMEMFMKSA